MSLEAVELCDLPMGSYPRVVDRVSGFEVGSIWLVETTTSFDGIIFFGYSLFGKDSGVSPKEVLEMEWASGNSTAFVKAVDEAGVWSTVVS